MKKSLSTATRILALTVAVSTAFVLAGCSGGNSAQPSGSSAAPKQVLPLNVGYIGTSINGAGIIAIANQEKLWTKAGLDVHLSPFTDGPTSIQAMQSGQIDIAYIGSGAVWMPASGQATIIAPSEVSTGDVLLAQPGAGIKSLADLKGKSIGYPQGGTGEMIMDLALKKAGLTKDDVKEVALTAPNVVTAFVGKQIDVAAIFSPLSEQILQSVPATVTLAKDTTFPGTVFMGAWVANNNAVKTKAEAIQRFLQVYAQANDSRIKNTKQSVEWASQLSGTPVSQLTQQASVSKWTPSAQILKNNQDGTTYKQFQSLQDVFVQTGRLQQTKDPKTFVNTQLFAQAMKALGK